MKLHLALGLASTVVLVAFGAPSFAAPAIPGDQRLLEEIQYDRYQEQRRDDDHDRDVRGSSKWVPGQVLPGRLLERVVVDWEERGLSRPPNGHQWVRVGLQFILVRGRDRMIARVINFD